MEKLKGRRPTEWTTEQFFSLIGRTDDEAVYTLAEGLSRDWWTVEEQRHIVDAYASDERLAERIGEESGMSVFTRASSATLLTLALEADEGVLRSDQLERLFAQVPRILSEERDVRSYVATEETWAHVVGAQLKLLRVLIRHETFEKKYAPVILQALTTACWKGAYEDDEAEQIAAVVVALVDQNVEETLLVEWVERLFERLSQFVEWNGYTSHYVQSRNVTMHVAQALYFQLRMRRVHEQVQSILYSEICNRLPNGGGVR